MLVDDARPLKHAAAHEQAIHRRTLPPLLHTNGLVRNTACLTTPLAPLIFQVVTARVPGCCGTTAHPVGDATSLRFPCDAPFGVLPATSRRRTVAQQGGRLGTELRDWAVLGEARTLAGRVRGRTPTNGSSARSTGRFLSGLATTVLLRHYGMNRRSLFPYCNKLRDTPVSFSYAFTAFEASSAGRDRTARWRHRTRTRRASASRPGVGRPGSGTRGRGIGRRLRPAS